MRSLFATVAAAGLLGFATADVTAQAPGQTPKTPAIPTFPLPPVEVRKLSNGIEVAVMRDTRKPAVSIGVALDVSSDLDPPGKAGLSDFTKAMLSQGTLTRSAQQLLEAAAKLEVLARPTFVHAKLPNLDRALTLMADQLLDPVFPQESLDSFKTNATTNLRQGKNNLHFPASRVFKSVLYGADHPYARQESEASIAAITRADVQAFYDKYIRPPNVRFAVVGDITADSAVAKLERHFGKWQAGTSARIDIPTPKPITSATLYLHDRPGAPESVIWIGGAAPRRDTPDYAAISVMNTILGGSPMSRLNANLRKQHGYTNGAQSGFAFRRVPEPGTFITLAAVKATKTDSAVVEMLRELRAIREERPITDEEFKATHNQLVKQLPLELDATQQRAMALMDLFANNLPLDYFDSLNVKLNAVTRDAAQATARAYITPERFTIIVVGDKAKIEAGLRAANIAPVVVVDESGAPVKAP